MHKLIESICNCACSELRTQDVASSVPHGIACGGCGPERHMCTAECVCLWWHAQEPQCSGIYAPTLLGVGVFCLCFACGSIHKNEHTAAPLPIPCFPSQVRSFYGEAATRFVDLTARVLDGAGEELLEGDGGHRRRQRLRHRWRHVIVSQHHPVTYGDCTNPPGCPVLPAGPGGAAGLQVHISWHTALGDPDVDLAASRQLLRSCRVDQAVAHQSPQYISAAGGPAE
jgi:hypothetical protein